MCAWLLDTIGLGITFIGALLLMRFGVTFHGDQPGVGTGKSWTKLCLTMERGQQLSFGMLFVGFILQFVARFL